MNNPLTLDELYRLLITWVLLSIISFLFSRQVGSLKKSVLIGALSRFMMAWIGLSILGFVFAKPLLEQFIPAVSWMMGFIQQDYSVELFFNDKFNNHVQLVSTLNVPIPPLNQGDTMNTSSNILPFLMLLVIIYALLIAWPVKSFLSRIKLLVLSAPVSFGLLILVMALQLAAVNELTLKILTNQFGLLREKSFFLIFSNFIQNSESWLRSVILVIIGSAILPRAWLKYKQ